MACFCLGCSKSKFNGSKVANENEFLLKYSVFNTTYEQKFDLTQGNVIKCSIEADKGNVDIVIQKKNGEKVYQGNDVPTGNFDVEIEENGEYTISVIGNKAAGSVSFEIVE